MSNYTCCFQEYDRDKKAIGRCGCRAVVLTREGRIFDGLCFNHLTSILDERTPVQEEYENACGQKKWRDITPKELLRRIEDKLVSKE